MDSKDEKRISSKRRFLLGAATAAPASFQVRTAAQRPLVAASAGYTRTNHVTEFVVPLEIKLKDLPLDALRAVVYVGYKFSEELATAR